MPGTSTFAVALVQSHLVGDKKGDAFNDIETVGHYPASLTINVDNPIRKIEVLYGDVIDGLSVTYNETAISSTQTVSHGTLVGSIAPGLLRQDINLNADENIIAITGKAGVHPVFGKRVCELSFVIYNRLTGHSIVAEPYGNISGHNYGEAFRVTANGVFVAFGGYAANINESIGQATLAHVPGGIYGLTFADVAYRQA